MARKPDPIGPVDGLSETMRRALDPADSFEPIPEHGPGDWLAVHEVTGQTFQQFVESKPNKPTKKRNKIYLQPLGEFSDGSGPSLERLRQFTAAFFDMPVEVADPVDLDGANVTSRVNPQTGKTQLLTTDMLKALKQRVPEDAFFVIGVTMVDLYPGPSWNFVFGQTSPPERVGVASFARYDPRFHDKEPSDDGDKLILRRSCKLLAQLTGQMSGVSPCVFFSCIMNWSNHLEEFDRNPLHLCPVDLRKLHHSVGFDVVDRYRKLRDFWREAGCTEEAAWLTERLRLLDPDSHGE